MIRSFDCRDTERIWKLQFTGRWSPDVERVAKRKMAWLHAARDLMDLRVPPGNRLEKLKGDRAGRHSIRVNDQWRICFEWRDGDAWNVELVDYH